MEIKVTGSAEYGGYIKELICGDPGSGKTLTSSTYPNPFYASAEGGLMSIADRSIPYIDLTSSAQLEEIRRNLAQPPEVREKLFGRPVETLVVDTIDEVQKIFSNERKAAKRIETLDQASWGWLGEQMRALIRGLRNLNLHVVLTCHLKESRDDTTGQIFYSPALQGAMGSEIAQYMDLAVLLKAMPQVKPDGTGVKHTTVRHLQTYPDASHPWIKDRSGKLPPEFPINFEDDYERKATLIFGDISKRRELIAEQRAREEEEAAKAAAELRRVVEEVATPTTEEVLETAATGRDEPAETVEIEEASTTSPEPEATVEESKPEKEKPEVETYKCSACGNDFDSLDQKELSMILLNRVLCVSCYREAKAKK